jgi:hypothetical protein
MWVEIGSEVRNDGVGEAKKVQDVAHEGNHSICWECCDWLVLNLLGKLVNGHQYVSKTTRRGGQRPYHVQAPACKRPWRWVMRLWAGIWGYLLKNLQFVHHQTSAWASAKVVGQ